MIKASVLSLASRVTNTIMDLFLDHAFPYDFVLLDW